MSETEASAIEEATSAVVSFILVSPLPGFCFNPHRPNGMTFDVPGSEARVSIRSRNAPGTSRDGYDNLEAKVSCSLSTSTEVAEFVDAICRGYYLLTPKSPVKLPVRVRGKERINGQGRVLAGERVPFELYPKSVQSLWTTANERLSSTLDKFLRLLRWNQDVDGPQELQEQASIYWRAGNSEVGAEHHASNAPRSFDRGPASAGRGGNSIVWEEQQASMMNELWVNGASEPLAHELLREARRLVHAGSRRAALLMAATAVETGVKDHIGRLRPHTQWILQHLPSPPVRKLLGKYIPEMHADTSTISDWSLLTPLWNACGKLADARNETSHAGTHVSADSLDAHLETAADVLYLLDVLGGHDWARRKVSDGLRNRLGWPDPYEKRMWSWWSADSWEVDETA